MSKLPEDSEQRKQQQVADNDKSALAAKSSNAVAGQDEANSSESQNGEQQQQQQTIKQFSEKTLQQLADYYLNLEPADIPDTGFVVSGIAGRFPNADNLNELWDNLLNGRDMVLGPDDKRWPLGKCWTSIPGRLI